MSNNTTGWFEQGMLLVFMYVYVCINQWLSTANALELLH